jgi:hypothetical protein
MPIFELDAVRTAVERACAPGRMWPQRHLSYLRTQFRIDQPVLHFRSKGSARDSEGTMLDKFYPVLLVMTS